MKELILASASPRRRELLTQLKLQFRVLPSFVDENMLDIEGTPEQLAEKIASSKAREIANGINEGIVIGADTIVVFNNYIFGKPKDEGDAFYMLSSLSGNTHQVITAIAVIDSATGKQVVAHEKTEVVFSQITTESINWYIKTKEPFDKAGAYGVQGLGAIFVKKIDGCYFNVVGLPLNKLCQILKDFDVNILSD